MRGVEDRPLGAVAVGARHGYFPGVEDAGSTGKAYAIFRMDVGNIVARSTRHLVTDARFATILEEDFGIASGAILKALEGESQKQAIEICARVEKPRKRSYRLRAASPNERERRTLWAKAYLDCVGRNQSRPSPQPMPNT